MTVVVIDLPKRYGPEKPPRRRGRKNATVVQFWRDPQAAEVLYRRASKLDEVPHTTRLAERLYREAIRLNPRHAMAMTNLGNVLFRRGDDRCVDLWIKALEIDAEQPEALYNHGHWLHSRGSWREAIARYRAAATADPTFADAWYNLGMAYDVLSERLSAATMFEQYLMLEPKGMWADRARHYVEKNSCSI